MAERRPLRAVFWPPDMVIRQAASVFLFARLAGWRKSFRWIMKFGFRALPVAAGAVGMGCIGFPNHPVLEITSECNLRCIHCHASDDESRTGNNSGGGQGAAASGGAPGGGKAGVPDGELSTEEAKRLIDELAAVREFRMLVFTGGEPMVRPDLFELLRHSQRAGFFNVIATNATLIDEPTALELRKSGVCAAAVSIDSNRPEVHNRIRRDPRAFERAMAGIKALKKAGIMLQVNVTAMEYNIDHIEDIIALADSLEAGLMLVYQLVPVGRGGAISDAALDIGSNEILINKIVRAQRKTTTLIEPVAGPQYWPWLIEQSKGFKRPRWIISGLGKAAKSLFRGCSAGRGFVYIKPNGEVWPCPFVEMSAGNVRERPFAEIWKGSRPFGDLRDRVNRLKDDCGKCEHRRICGGCRGRALAMTGDLLAADPSCFLNRGHNIVSPVHSFVTSSVGPRSGPRR